jgi:hypothetical protein
MRVRQALLVVAAATAAALVTVPFAGAKTPQAVYKALLNTPVKASQLPHGYKNPQVGDSPLTATAKSHNAVGSVQIFADGGNEAVLYIIFATAADARLDWANAHYPKGSGSAAPSSIPKPSVLINTSTTGTVNGKSKTFGLTDVASLRGNVIVQGVTTSGTNAKHGDVAGSVALAQFAIAHLKALS